MDNEIYLISSDGHRDRIDLDGYFSTDEELIEYATKDFAEWNFGSIIQDVKIGETDNKIKLVVVYYFEDWDKEKEYLDRKYYYTFKLRKWK